MTDDQPAAAYNEAGIYPLRGQQVMLGIDLARLHRIAPESLGQAVERNLAQFPDDSLLRLTREELAGIGLAAADAGSLPNYAFTAEGVAILAALLFDERELHEQGRSRASTCKCRR